MVNITYSVLASLMVPRRNIPVVECSFPPIFRPRKICLNIQDTAGAATLVESNYILRIFWKRKFLRIFCWPHDSMYVNCVNYRKADSKGGNLELLQKPIMSLSGTNCLPQRGKITHELAKVTSFLNGMNVFYYYFQQFSYNLKPNAPKNKLSTQSQPIRCLSDQNVI